MKHRFDKVQIANASAALSSSFVFLEISVWLNDLAHQSNTYRYLQQLTVIITIVLAVRAFNAVRKLIPKTLRRAVFAKLLYIARKVATTVSNAGKKILNALGFSTVRYKKRKDESSFIFDVSDIGLFKRFSTVKNSLKWRDLTENAEKIRFIYVKYIVKLIKNGFEIPAFLTPNEVRTGLELEPETTDDKLFDLYNGARYSGGSIHISDEEVEMTLALVNGKKK